MSGRPFRPGPDPDFPVLSERQRFAFPDPADAEDSVVGVGGNLSPGMLLSAYEQGIFPWFNEDDPVIWQSPDPRFLFFPDTLHVSRSLGKLLQQGRYRVTFDQDFAAVIRGCAGVHRPGQGGTWITADMIAAYTELHRLGWAHSAEARLDGELVGGCYGIRLGRAFFGESMFALRPNASKAAFISLAQFLFADGVDFIDSQVATDHTRSLGGRELSRRNYLDLLARALAGPRGDKEDRRGSWLTRPYAATRLDHVKDAKNVLILVDGAPATRKVADRIAAGLKGLRVVLMEAADFAATDLLPADACFIGCEKPKPAGFSELERVLRGINLAGRPCGLFSPASEAAVVYLKTVIADAELQVNPDSFLADQEKTSSRELKSWVEKTLGRS